MPYPAQTDRETIIQTARTLIEAEGLEQLSLGRLAEALGVKAPSLYRYVRNKAQLLQAVHLQTIQALFEAYEAAIEASDGTPQARLQAILRAHRAFAHAHPQSYILAFTSTDPAERTDASLLAQMVLPIQELMAQISGPEQSLAALRGALALVHGFVLLELKGQLQRGGDLGADFEAAVAAYLRGW